MASRETEKIVQAIANALAESDETTIVPATFTHIYGRAATTAAFRLAKRRGIVEACYRGGLGTPVYRRPFDWDKAGVFIYDGETVAVPN